MDTMEMDASAEETRLPADVDAQPVVRAAAALRPVLRGLFSAPTGARCRW